MGIVMAVSPSSVPRLVSIVIMTTWPPGDTPLCGVLELSSLPPVVGLAVVVVVCTTGPPVVPITRANSWSCSRLSSELGLLELSPVTLRFGELTVTLSLGVTVPDDVCAL